MGQSTKEFLNITELAKFLNIKESMLRSLVFNKKIPFIKIGRLLRFDREEIIKWLEIKKVCE